jgi:hypothetical protein
VLKEFRRPEQNAKLNSEKILRVFFTVPIRNANTRAAYYRAIQSAEGADGLFDERDDVILPGGIGLYGPISEPTAAARLGAKRPGLVSGKQELGDDCEFCDWTIAARTIERKDHRASERGWHDADLSSGEQGERQADRSHHPWTRTAAKLGPASSTTHDYSRRRD